MRSQGFRRFVAIFVGVLVVLGWIAMILTGDENLGASVLTLTVLNVVYLVIIVKKAKEQPAKDRKKPESPLLRR